MYGRSIEEEEIGFYFFSKNKNLFKMPFERRWAINNYLMGKMNIESAKAKVDKCIKKHGEQIIIKNQISDKTQK